MVRPSLVAVRHPKSQRLDTKLPIFTMPFEGMQKLSYKLNKNIMMEVMIPNRARFHEFEKTGIPWSNVVAFVGHTPPQDKELLRMLHAKGVLCIAGTSRNLDRQLAINRATGTSAIEEEYRALLQRGVDLIETDLPRETGNLLYGESAIPASKSRFFHSS